VPSCFRAFVVFGAYSTKEYSEGMKRFGANYIFPITRPPIRNGIIEIDDYGTITDIIEPSNDFQEIHSTQFFNGIIVPGFINAHCHLELSHLKGLKPSQPGIASFIEAVTKQRNDSNIEADKSIADAINEAESSGTVAIADICNTNSTLPYKLKTGISFHNFIELFGLNPNHADTAFNNGLKVFSEFQSHFPNTTWLTPHSTYSISEPLWNKISNFLTKSRENIASIHYAESMAEYEFLAKGTGPLFDRYSNANIPFVPTKGESPMSIITKYIPEYVRILLVHNTFASTEELSVLKKRFHDLTLVACPESNLTIESKLPPLIDFESNGFNIAMGTDSLASASSLSMLAQIMIILKHFPTIEFQTALKWATLNGAKALNMDKSFGSIEVGKKPGLVLIDHFNFTNLRPTSQSVAKRLM